jgi:putative transposase
MGLAAPHRIGRHTHPAARPDIPPSPAPETGIDYLRLVAAARDAEQAQAINFAALTDAGNPQPDPTNNDDPR